ALHSLYYLSRYLSLSYPHAHLPAPHSFPTRRSSDLRDFPPRPPQRRRPDHRVRGARHRQRDPARGGALLPRARRPLAAAQLGQRSEEHTSELQSHLNLVCRLLLEKKKKKTRQSSAPN